MKADLKGGVLGQILEGGRSLAVLDADDELLFTLDAPAHSIFYLFTEHITAGPCPVVCFESSHMINGWPDWFYQIDFKTQTMTRLNPWK